MHKENRSFWAAFFSTNHTWLYYIMYFIMMQTMYGALLIYTRILAWLKCYYLRYSYCFKFFLYWVTNIYVLDLYTTIMASLSYQQYTSTFHCLLRKANRFTCNT